MSLSKKVKLPECGIFVGSGVYQSQEGYLSRSGRSHTAWVPESFSPLDVLKKVIEDNQGNLVQYWGLEGGWGFNASDAPVPMARFHALEDLGIEAPLPDWDNARNLSVKEWNIAAEYPERYGAGVHKFIQEAARRGIYSMLIYTEAKPDWSQRFEEAGPYYLGYDFGEVFSFRLEEEHVQELSIKNVDLRLLAQNLMSQVREQVSKRNQSGWGTLMTTSASFHLDYEVAAGVEVPLVEDFAFQHLNMASALARGLYRQFDLPMWGSHIAHEHYSWNPFSCEHKFDLLRVGFFQKYMAGAKVIILESGNWFLQTTKAVDAPMYRTPRLELGSIRNKDPYRVAPHVEEARKAYPHIGYDSPTAKRYREELSDFYDYVKENGTPQGQPEVTLAVLKGNYDLSGKEFNPNEAVAGMYSIADQNPLWYSGQPERGWETVRQVFYPRPPVLEPYPNLYVSGTPYGMVDIVSLVDDQVQAEFLKKQYKALLFSGWNTCSEKQYAMLCDYVRSGGILFVSIPHLSTDVNRRYTNYGVADLVNGGDFSELCGVKVLGKGKRYYWAIAPDDKGTLGFQFPRRFGVMGTSLGNIEIVDPNHEVLVVEDEEMEPLLIRRNYGKGTVYFLNSWSYPGALNADYGPGGVTDSPGLIGMIYRHIARSVRGTVWITDDGVDAGKECQYVSCSYFPEDGSICLLNTDFKKPHTVILHQKEHSQSVTLQPMEFWRAKVGEK